MPALPATGFDVERGVAAGNATMDTIPTTAGNGGVFSLGGDASGVVASGAPTRP